MDNLNQLIADARRGGWRFWRHWRQVRGAFIELADSTKNVELEKQLQSATQQLAEVNFRLNAVNGVMQTTQKELEEARAGNKKLADWIATTHRVDLKSTLGMKLFSAAKKVTVLFVLCAGMDAAAQAPPIIRNPVTTNSITNGVINWVLTWFAPTSIGWSPMTGGGSGETNYNGEVFTNSTHIGWVFDKQNATNRLKSASAGFGMSITNQGTNNVFSVDNAIIASQADLNAASNAVKNAIPPSLTTITGGASMGSPTTNVAFNAGTGLAVGGSVTANTNIITYQFANLATVLGGSGWQWTGTSWTPSRADGGWVIDEAFITTLSSPVGREGWSRALSGSGSLPISPSSTNWGVVEFKTTTAADRVGLNLGPAGTAAQIVVTNVEFWMFFRCMARTTNSPTTFTNNFWIGLHDGLAAAPNNGVFLRYIQNSNYWEACTAAGGATITSGGFQVISNDEWIDVAAHWETSQTQVVFYAATTGITNATQVAALSGLPGAVVTPAITSRMPVGAGNCTNSVDYFRLWMRRF